jgi:hypothetical protein
MWEKKITKKDMLEKEKSSGAEGEGGWLPLSFYNFTPPSCIFFIKNINLGIKFN